MRQLTTLVLIFFLAVILSPPTAAASEMIRVGLAEGQTRVMIAANQESRLIDRGSGAVVARAEAGHLWDIRISGSQMSVTGVGTFRGPLVLLPVTGELADGSDNWRVRYGGRQYRGALEILRTADGMTVINELSLEEYLYGVLPKEVSPGWPVEVLKAQAVAARTYALYVKSSGRFAARGFDICATQSCQVYGGADSEDERSNAAVDATRGQVLVYDGKLIAAYFHASSGGHTENSENVWSSYRPYLRGVPDFDQDSPHYSWRRTVSSSDLATALSLSGYGVGEVRAVEGGRKGVSGRLIEVRVVGSSGERVLDADVFRDILDLKSTLIDEIRVQEGGVADIQRELSMRQEVTVLGAGGATRKAPLFYNAVRDRTGSFVRRREYFVLGRQSVTASVELVGRGWGHGLGLSQWGARAMALKGHNYQEILQYYYQGTEVVPDYGR